MSTSAERMRTHRQRIRRGLKCLSIELRISEIKELTKRGFVAEASAKSTQEIRKGLYAFLDHNLSARV